MGGDPNEAHLVQEALVRAQNLVDNADLEGARRLLLPLIENAVSDPTIFNLLATIEFKTKKLEESARFLERSLSLNPNQADAQMRLAIVLDRLHRPDEALATYERALAIDPERPVAHYNKAHLLQSMRRYEEAFGAFDAALQIDSRYLNAWLSKALLLQFLGRFRSALEAFDQALAIYPDQADLQTAKAELLLTMGEYPEGWRLFEWRWRSKFRATLRPPRRAQLWLGDAPLSGKSIAILHEGGFGDSLMFARYASLLKAAGAVVLLQAARTLHGLFGSLGKDIQLIDPNDALPRSDFYCPLMSLPLAFGSTLQTIPATFPYLEAPSDRRSLWRERLGDKAKPRIGIVWSGQKGRKIDEHPLRRRNLPLETLRPIFDLPCEFHVLQKEIDVRDEETLSRLPQIKRHDAVIADFSDTAALIELMDHVVTIDTSIAHLVGALGRPFWLMTAFAPDYRWMTQGPTTPWYPNARLFRQSDDSDWAPVVGQVKEALGAMWRL